LNVWGARTRTAQAPHRRRARAERRRRLAASLVAGLFVFAAMTPAHLGTADQPNFLPRLTITAAEASISCDKPRGQRFHLPEACPLGDPQPQAAQ
jgi:hypothetical protein